MPGLPLRWRKDGIFLMGSFDRNGKLDGFGRQAVWRMAGDRLETQGDHGWVTVPSLLIDANHIDFMGMGCERVR